MIRGACVALALAASTLTVVQSAHALPSTCTRRKYGTDLAVVHANGMRTDLGDAKASLEKLRPLIETRLHADQQSITYAVAYNQKKGWLTSIYKVIKERIPMSVSQIVRMLSGLEPVPEALRDELVRWAAERDLGGFEDDASLTKHVNLYRQYLRTGRKTLVIAHSEGNMYANAAYRQLFEIEPAARGDRAFGIVGIASPAPALAGSWRPPGCDVLRGCYTTLADDKIIGAVIRQLGDTAPANIHTDTPGTTDVFFHKLDETYLRNAEAREQILDHVAAFVGAFEPFEGEPLTDSEITADLTWDNDADLDLHVWEGRNHVYIDFPASKVHGGLEADALDGGGPEHYYSVCEGLKQGDFIFAVGYFAGVGPVTATLNVKVGSITRSYTRVFDEAAGSASLTRPLNMARIKVLARDRKGNLAERYDDATNELIDEYQFDLVEVPALH